ncbi:MAG: ribosomal-processing cysteine protease Prp [Clostridia bacterium]|jgi:uncharacterized protein YsxB (DUF464 family)
MIRVSIKRNKQKSIVEYRVTGHSGYDECGRDIVCSAVSTLSQAVIIGLEKVAGIAPKYWIKDGDLHCIIPPLDVKNRREADLLLDTMYHTLISIKQSYPENISISEMEV